MTTLSTSSSSSLVVYQGIIIHAISMTELEIYDKGQLGVEKGVITFLQHVSSSSNTTPTTVFPPNTLIDLGEQIILPGFIDGHAHAPQYAYLGIGMHLPLLEWLNKYTFAYESEFHDLEYANTIYRKAVQRSLCNGSTTVSYFATIHLEASKLLVDIVQEYGQRGFIGKVNMDRNAPETLLEKTQESIKETRDFISYVLKKEDELLTPVITPRFVPSTSSALMSALGALSREHTPFLPVQSHLSENDDEIKWVKSLHPSSDSYTAVYDEHGLLHEVRYCLRFLENQ